MTARFKTAYGKHLNPSIETGPGLTHQSFKDDVDINNIVSRFEQTGILDHQNQREPLYGDYDSEDLHTAMNIVADANSMFADLPSSIRNRFHNNPAEYLDFCQNPDNIDELVDLGLAERNGSENNDFHNSTPPVSNQPAQQASIAPASASTEPSST